MAENENNPVLIAIKPLESKFDTLQKIVLSSANFTIGRGLKNSAVIGFCSISRDHCTFRKIEDNKWFLLNNSMFGIKINNVPLGKGLEKQLNHEDIIELEPSKTFVYKFTIPSDDVFEIPTKRRKMAENNDCSSIIIDNVKKKFDQSQKCEIKYLQERIQNSKKIQETSKVLIDQLQEDMNRKIQNLDKQYSIQIENLKGEKNEVERQKASLIEERDAQLLHVKNEMEGKISDLMKQIKTHVETEFDLQKENSSLKEKLLKEREDFLSELNRESSSKKELLAKLEAKIQEQEEIRQREIQELQETLRRETEQLQLAKEKELKELEEQKHQREIELQEELSNIRKNLAEQVQQSEQQRLKAEQELNQQLEEMNKLKAEDKAKMDQLQKEREDIQTKLTLAQMIAEKSIQAEKARVIERETELAALAAERIQIQADQSSEVISTLQDQLEKMKSQLLSVETEKNTILENLCSDSGEGTSKQTTLNEFGELMESELQCSICAELFVEATVLNCSHTYCKYCITMWKKKKKDCPICRARITSECKSLVLDSFIEKMVQNLTEEMKTKRQDILKFRAAEVQNSTRRPTATTTSSARRRRTTTTATAATGHPTTTRTSGRGAGGATATGARAIPTVDLTTLPIPMNPRERPPVLPPPLPITLLRHPAQMTRHQVPTTTVDLTHLPVQQISMSPSYNRPVIMDPQVPIRWQLQMRQPIPPALGGRQMMVFTIGGGVVTSQGHRGHITVATGGASLAEPAATGPPAAPFDNTNQSS